MGLKIAVVGGGSTYTPELVEGFAARSARLPVDELVLLDVDPERLEIVAGLAGRILARRGWSGRVTATLDRSAALDGADFVVVQLRVGGQAARFLDDWIARAQASGIKMLQKFARTLQVHRTGLLNWYKYPISTGPLEGTNTKIRVLQRQAYGFRIY